MTRTITAIMILAAIAGGALSLSAKAAVRADLTPQEVKQNQVKEIKNTAEMHYQRGEQAYQNGEYNQARREFDEAVDIILNRIGSVDIQSDDDLRAYYRSLIERINRYQVAALEQKDGGFNEQRYEPSPLDKIASLSDADLDEAGPEDDASEEVAARVNFKYTVSHPVNQFINYFTKGRGRSTMEAGLYRSARYRAMAESVFKEEGVPTDLIWLAQVESGWNPYAMSWASARGIWQFIPTTGSRFGLAQNYWVDERSNPEKSTRAAAKYLKWLADRYRGDWMLALAAYNTGEGNIDSAIARSGSRDFWQIHRGGYIAQETRNYVPAILAVVQIAKAPKKYGFEIPPTYPLRFETRMVAAQTDLKPLAKKLKISYGALLDLNPELQRGVTPPGKHIIRIPASLITKAASTVDQSEAVTNNE
jgi:membrane-bound lytic murein transglycosylase D